MLGATFYCGPGQEAERLARWSQLGGVVHAMLEFGVAPDAVLTFVDDTCKAHRVDDGQRKTLVDHVMAQRPGISEA